MGTVEKIVDTLNKMCMDKKSQATHRYDEHSAWLASEFTNLRNLIQVQNPRTSESRDSSESRQKRKSPETCSNGFRNSPQAKRNSSGFADIAVAEGLPVDLNRLKKEELLAALESRGNCTMTMKALKKDLVDALKELLLDIHARDNREPEQPLTTDDVSETAEVISVTEAADSIQDSVPTVELASTSSSGRGGGVGSPQVRKVSILAEARQQINGARQSVLQEKQESSMERSQRLTQEYEARKMRHRLSQVRVSNATGGAGETRSRNESVESSGQADNDAVVEQNEVSDMPDETSAPVCDGAEAGGGDDEDGVWNEVPSPPRESSTETPPEAAPQDPPAPPPSSASKLVAGYEPKTLFANAPVSNKSVPGREHAKTLPVGGSATVVAPASDSTKEADNAIKPVPVQKYHSSDSIPEDQKTGQAAVGSASSASSGGMSHMKKLSNLIGGTQTSFLGSSSTSSSSFLGSNKDKTDQNKPKTVVPALQQAMKQKEKEEARAAQKKKDLEEKKREYMRKMQQSSNSSVQSTATSKLFPSKLTNSKPSAPSTVSQPTQKKAGFGWFGKKEAAPVAAAAPSVENTGIAKPQPLTAAQLALKTSAQKQFGEQQHASADPEETVADQENTNPSESSTAPVPPVSAPVSAHKVLGERKVDPAEYKQPAAPGTPSAPTKHDEDYEPSPPREEYPIANKYVYMIVNLH